MSGERPEYGVVWVAGDLRVLAAWDEWRARAEEVREARVALMQRFDGRSLLVRRLGFGHDTTVVGFEEREGDRTDPPAPLRWNKTDQNLWVNRKLKAGRDLEVEVRDTCTQTGPSLPGMPPFSLTNMRALAPALKLIDGVVWAHWSEDPNDKVDEEIWERARLSEYYAAMGE